MDYKKPRKTVRTGPEAAGALRLKRYMVAHGWLIDKLGGGKFTVGWPDYYCYHPIYGPRWLETKSQRGKLRSSQVKRFTRLASYGDKIFVLTDEKDYHRLFQEKDNWRTYIRPGMLL